jgi:hypothetical protein
MPSLLPWVSCCHCGLKNWLCFGSWHDGPGYHPSVASTVHQPKQKPDKLLLGDVARQWLSCPSQAMNKQQKEGRKDEMEFH